MMRYPVSIDGEEGAWGVVFPDLPGIVAMGRTVEEALENAGDALRDYLVETREDGVDPKPPSAPEDIEILPGRRLAVVAVAPPEPPRRAAAG